MACVVPPAQSQQELNLQGPNVSASTLLRPGLTTLAQCLGELRVDRWKLSQAARDEVQTNIASIRRDLDTTLPDLLLTADAKPTSLASALPVSRNVDALYDVLLRTLERGRMAAPSEQAASLDRARVALDQARRAFDSALQGTAAVQEQALQRLQSAPAPALPCVPAVPAKKRKAKAQDR